MWTGSFFQVDIDYPFGFFQFSFSQKIDRIAPQ